MPLPDTIWHYTNAAGLHGIITNKQLHFGDARFMNDRTERTYADTMLREVQAILDHPALPDLQVTLDALRLPDRLYVCCLSTNTESISQWQRYGGDGAGYCIGFRTHDLLAVMEEDYVSITDMLYDPAAQREHLRDALNATLREFAQLREANKNYLHYLMLDVDLDSVILRLKHPAFHDEQEWRLYRRTPNDEEDTPLTCAPRGSYIKPYLALPTNHNQPLPIAAVIAGPRLDHDIAIPATQTFLATNQIMAPVTASNLTTIWR